MTCPLIQWQRLRVGSGAWVRLDRKLEGLSILRLPGMKYEDVSGILT